MLRKSVSNLVQRFLDRFLGHDFFIAHGHSDGSDFVERLHQGLKKQHFSVFLDEEEEGYRGGDRIDRGTRRFAGNARRLIVVFGPGALCSNWVHDEVEASQKAGRVQILIDNEERQFARASDDTPLKKLLANRKWLTRETNDANFDQIVLDLAGGFARIICWQNSARSIPQHCGLRLVA